MILNCIKYSINFLEDKEDYEDSAEICPEAQNDIDSSGPPSLKVGRL